MTAPTARRRALASLTLFLVLLAACGDDDDRSLEDRARDAASDVASEVDERVDQGVARAQAELLRERIKDAADGDATQWPAVTVIQQAVDDLPRDPDVTGLEDADGDGRDDDGKVGLAVDDSHACVTIGADDIDVSGDAC
jgi:hypothetical protein